MHIYKIYYKLQRSRFLIKKMIYSVENFITLMLSNSHLDFTDPSSNLTKVYKRQRYFWTYLFKQVVNTKEEADDMLLVLKKITCLVSYHIQEIRIMLVGPNSETMKLGLENQWKFYFLSENYRFNQAEVCKDDGTKVLCCYLFQPGVGTF